MQVVRRVNMEEKMVPFIKLFNPDPHRPAPRAVRLELSAAGDIMRTSLGERSSKGGSFMSPDPDLSIRHYTEIRWGALEIE